MNFVPSMRAPSDGRKWGGYTAENGSFSGLNGSEKLSTFNSFLFYFYFFFVGDLQFDRTDVGVANLFLRFPEANHVGFTYPYFYDKICFLVAFENASVRQILVCARAFFNSRLRSLQWRKTGWP